MTAVFPLNFHIKCLINCKPLVMQQLYQLWFPWLPAVVWVTTGVMVCITKQYCSKGSFALGKFGGSSWMDLPILSVQITNFIDRCLFSLLGITLTWLVARTAYINNTFFLCCHCFWIMGIPDLPRSSELSSSHLSPLRSPPSSRDLHWPCWVSTSQSEGTIDTLRVQTRCE